MGQLIEEDIPSLYNGVSRQPANVRMTSQVQDAVNVDFSVVTGGFEKRDPLQLLGPLTGIDTAETWCLHTIDRDEVERYDVLVSSAGVIKIYDGFDGSTQTLTYTSGHEADVTAYLTSGTTDAKQRFAFLTIVDVTYVVNREVNTALATATTGTVTGQKQTFADLVTDVPSPSDGVIYEITGGASELDNYFVKWVAADNQWTETVDPNGQNDFDLTTMPIKITRTSSGVFEASRVDWSSRSVGSQTTVPAPKWIGFPLTDIVFYKNRVGLLGESNIYFSQAGDFTNLWPDKATDVLDSDPIDLAATGSRVSFLKWGVPYRKTLFITADRVQFEQNNAGILTPFTATIDETTAYATTNRTKPVVMGSELYFAGEVSGNGIIYEYYFDEATLSNTADDVTKHVLGFLPGGISRMAADPASGKLFVMCGNRPNDLYVYTVYWNGSEKIQSAWGKWTFDSAIMDFDVLTGELHVVTLRGADVLLQKIAISDTNTDLGFNIALDQKTSVTGVYDGGTGLTTWTLPYAHNDAVVGVLSSQFTLAGKSLFLTAATANTVTATGDLSAYPVIFGFTYNSAVTFSRLYRRKENNASDLQGRIQARRMTLYYENSGYFQVDVTLAGKGTKTHTYSGRNVGLLNNLIGSLSIADGDFNFPVMSRTDRITAITVRNDTFIPFTITSATWIGFMNSIARQG